MGYDRAKIRTGRRFDSSYTNDGILSPVVVVVVVVSQLLAVRGVI